jgi:CHAT domain-containing protein
LKRGPAANSRSTIALLFRGAAGQFLLETQAGGYLHERGVATLVSSDPSEALKLLDSAVQQSPADASALSDLAAARLAAADVNGDMQLFASALAASDAALRRNPASPEARFNRALALDRLQLHEPAAVAYQHYLAVDNASPWSTEVRRNLAHCTYETDAGAWTRTRTQIERLGGASTDVIRAVRIFPYYCRAWGEAVYLPSWADEVRAGRKPEADHFLSLARAIGASLQSQSGESFLADAVAMIDRADVHTRGVLVNGYAEYKEGRQLLSARQATAAKTPLASASNLFKTADSAMMLIAQFYLANAAMDAGEDQEALRLLTAVGSATPSRYASLTARVAMQEGVVLARRGRVHEALERTLFAANIFGGIGEHLLQTTANIGAANGFTILGRPTDAWKLRRAIMENVSRSGDNILFEHALNTAARDALSDHRPDIAEALINIELTHETTSVRLRIDALLCRLQAMPASDISLSSAELRSAIAAIREPALREEALDDIRFAEAISVRPRDALLSEQLISETIAFRTARSNELSLPSAYLEHARTLRRLQRNSEAITELEKAIKDLEQRQVITKGDFRDTVRGNAAEAYDELIDVCSALGDYDHAFVAAERGRAHRIMERLRSANGVSAERLQTSEELRARIPPGVTLAVYTTLPDRIVILALDRMGLHPHVVKVSPSEVQAERDELIRATIHPLLGSAEGASVRLYDQLVAPLKDELSGANELVIIPDATIAPLPFAILKNKATGRYLIEDLVLTFAPSTIRYVQALLRPKRGGAFRALIVGDPEFQQSLFPELHRLQNADTEARGVAALYRGAELRTGSLATRASVLAGMQSADLIHIAAHALTNDREPSLSVIPLAPDHEGGGLLYARDIASLRLTHAPVVILAGCETASATNAASAVSSLTSAFLVAGARTVIGTLWDVDDDIAAEASVALHNAMATGERPSSALRSVQLRMLRATDNRTSLPQSWSGLQSYGSGD